MGHRARFHVVVAALWAATGCGSAPGGAAGAPAVRDSGGIQIIEHPNGSESLLPQWTATELLLDIGAGEGPGHELSQVRGALRLSDGRVVVADQGAGELRFFDGAATYLSASGRKGNGPGEFSQFSNFQRLAADTLGVLDLQLDRYSLIAPMGGFVRSVPIGRRSEAGYVGVEARLADGRFLAASTRFPEMRETSGPVRRDSFAIGFIGRDGTGFDTLLVIPGNEIFPALGREGGQTFPTVHTVDFGKLSTLGTNGALIYVGTNEPVGIRVYESSGRLVRILRFLTPPEPVTEVHRKERAQETLALFESIRASEQIKAEWRKNAEAARFAEVFPDYERLLVGVDGTLWQERARRSADEGRRFIVYDPAGRAIATVACPDRFRPYQVGPAEIIGLWRDPDDVPHVRVYKVRSEK